MPISEKDIAKALATFAEMHGRLITSEMVKAYHGILGDDFTPETWAATCKHVARTDKFWPTAAALLEAQQHEADASVRADAEKAWEPISNLDRSLTVYLPTTGTSIDARKVRATLGPIAARSLLAIGGGSEVVSADPKTLGFLRRQFVDTFVRETRRAKDGAQGLIDAAEPSGAILEPIVRAPELVARLEEAMERRKPKCSEDVGGIRCSEGAGDAE